MYILIYMNHNGTVGQKEYGSYNEARNAATIALKNHDIKGYTITYRE